MKVTYHIIDKKDFDESHRKIFTSLLEQQGKVRGDLNQKID